MLKKYLLIILLILNSSVLISGCTSSFSTNSYDDKFIAFDYPTSMNVTGGNHTYGESISGETGDKRNGFIFEIWPVSDKNDSDYPSSLATWKTKWINDGLYMDIKTVKSGYTTIDGIKTAYTIDSDNNYDYYLVKGNMSYRLSFNGRTMSESDIQDILKSIIIK